MSFRIVGLVAGLISLLPIARADERRVQAPPSAVQSVIDVVLKRPKNTEIELKDGTKLSGKLIRAETSGLLVDAKGGVRGVVQVLPYDKLSTVRLDLGPDRDWQKLGIAIGTGVGMVGGLGVGTASETTANEVAGAVIFFGSPIIAGLLMSHFHRNWLIIEVH